MIDKLICDLMKITEDLCEMDSPTHMLSVLSLHHGSHKKHQGKMENVNGTGNSRGDQNSGTYARAC